MRKFILVISALLCGVVCHSQDGVIDVASLYAEGRISEAAALVSRLLAENPENDALFYYKGMCEASAGSVKAAEKDFLRAIELDPTNKEYIDALATMYATSNQEQKAATIYKAQMEMNPSRYSNPYVYFLVGDCEFHAGRDSSALEYYDKALIYDPEYAFATLGKADVYFYRGNFPAFFVCLNDFIRNPYLGAKGKTAYMNELFSHVDGSFYQVWHTQLDSLVEACLSVHPQDSCAQNFAGMWYYSTGREDRGRELFADVAAAYPNDARALLTQAELMYMAKDYKSALSNCARILKLSPDSTALLSALSLTAESYCGLKDTKNAFKAYTKALKIDPHNSLILNNYAYNLSLEKKSLEKALKMSAETITAEPDNPTFLDTYGWILHLLGRDAEAKPVFKHAMVYGGKSNAVVLGHYAEVLAALGETDLAEYYRDLAATRK